MKRAMFVLAAAALLFGGAVQAAESFNFGFEFPDQGGACPTKITLADGATSLAIPVYLTLTSAGIPTDGIAPADLEGPQGWSFGVQVDGATIDAAATFDPLTPPPDTPDPPDTKGLDLKVDTLRQGTAVSLLLWKAGFQVLEPAYADKAPHAGAPIGACSAIVLNQTKKQILLPNTTARIAKLVLNVDVPDPAAGKTVTIQFKDGLYGSGEPVAPVVTYKSASNTPDLGTCSFLVQGKVIQKEFQLSVLPAGAAATDIRTAKTEGDFNVLEATYTMGADEATKEVEVPIVVKIATQNLPGTDGPQGWSFGFQNDTALVADPAQFVLVGEDGDIPPPVQGVIVNTLRGDPGVAVALDLAKAGFKVAEQGFVDKNPHAGASVGVVTAIVLNQTKKQVLLANAVDTVLKINFKMTIAKGTNPDAKIWIQDGLFGSGEPVANVITYNSASQTPTITNGLIVRLTGEEVIGQKKDSFIRGDANNDGKIDIADVVWIVYTVVPGMSSGYSIPCQDAGDTNADAAVNIGDGAYLISYLFQAGSRPIDPFLACGTTEASTDVTCPDGSTNCPTAP